MKKLFLFLTMSILTLSLNSCSRSDSGSSVGGTATVTIDGAAKTFNTVVVNQTVENAGTADESTYLNVTAAIGTSTTEILTFDLYKGDVGAGAIYSFGYVKNGATYYGNISSNVTTNSTSNKLVGNFSGTLTDFNTGNEIVFTNGSFNVQY